MKIVYDEDTQKQIDFYENRQIEILEEIKKELSTATGQARLLALRELHPYCNPISLFNPEYEAINNILFRIRALAVPRYLISKEEYEACHGR